MKSDRLLILAGSFIVILVGASPAFAVIMGSTKFILDFSDPDAAKEKATWNDPDHFDITEHGFGFDGSPKSSRDLMIQTTELTAVGWSWRPVHSVLISATIEPTGKFTFGTNSITYPSGQLYARYSPDGKHWSSWNHLPMEKPKGRENPQQAYSGSLRVPYQEQESYQKLVREYWRRDVPWASDEEATVKWILSNDPEFFQKSLPFIGYVQFLFESHLRGGQRIERIRIDLSYGTGGMHSIPRDPEVRNNHKGPWRFTAESVKSAEQSTAADAGKSRD